MNDIAATILLALSENSNCLQQHGREDWGQEHRKWRQFRRTSAECVNPKKHYSQSNWQSHYDGIARLAGKNSLCKQPPTGIANVTDYRPLETSGAKYKHHRDAGSRPHTIHCPVEDASPTEMVKTCAGSCPAADSDNAS